MTRQLVLRSDRISNGHVYRHAVQSLMIRRFRHRGLKRMYERSDLADIDDAPQALGLDLPGYRLQRLKGGLNLIDYH